MYEKEKELLKAKEKFGIEDLLLIVKILRAPDGCPWDREQTHKSITVGMIEECYEVIEAIDAESSDMLCEELGDVLLQVVFHSQIEEELGVFDFNDAVSGVCKKMIVRHPHVFGDVIAKDSAAVLKNWDAIKAQTKEQKSLREKLDSIAKPLPALMRAQKVMHKTAKERSIPSPSEFLDEQEEKIGKMLFSAIAECEKLGLDAETVLRHYTDAIISEI